MDVEKLEAGRDLDALVAEKVMGMQVKGTSSGTSRFGIWTHLQHYSTSIEAAFEIIEHMKDDDEYEPEVFRFAGPEYDGRWHGGIFWCHHDGDIEMVNWMAAPTFPLLVCRLALMRKWLAENSPFASSDAGDGD